jgi:hypothetical protein
VGGKDALPARCPIKTRIAIPECRFHPRLLRELIQDGDLNETDGCPLRRVCQVEEGKDERKNRDVQFSGSGHLSDRYQGLGKPLRFVLRPERGLGSVYGVYSSALPKMR